MFIFRFNKDDYFLAGSVAEWVEYFPSTHRVLGANLNST